MVKLIPREATLESPLTLLFWLRWADDYIEVVPARFDLVAVPPLLVIVTNCSLVVVLELIGEFWLLSAEGVKGAEQMPRLRYWAREGDSLLIV